MDNSKSKVALIRSESYAEDKLITAIQKGFDLLGGANAFIKRGEKIVLKPNVPILKKV
jgi:uncharacterized protein (DUF362 family)